MNLTAPAAVAALETAFLDMLGAEPGGFGAFESEARSVALASCAEAMSRALEARDRELAASRPNAFSQVRIDRMICRKSTLRSRG